jgi:hypothetical protein
MQQNKFYTMLSYFKILNIKILSSALQIRCECLIDGLTAFADKNIGFAEFLC